MRLAQRLLRSELEEFNRKLRIYLQSSSPLLDKIMGYVVRSRGKQIRPLLLFLTARLFGQELSEGHYRAAACVEILHTATLIHDDVVDNAERRRGLFSLNALWKNKIAVLAGDYLLSKGLLIALAKQDYATLEALSLCVKQMSEGELLQFQKSRSMNLDEKSYFEIIDGKTASLLATACALGGPREDTRAYQLGLFLGRAFQIQDDILDFQLRSTGKPRAQDLKEGKITLPMIYALAAANFWERQQMRYLLKVRSRSAKNIAKLISFCEYYQGLSKASEKSQEFLGKAKEIINQFPHSPARESFFELIDFLGSRRK